MKTTPSASSTESAGLRCRPCMLGTEARCGHFVHTGQPHAESWSAASTVSRLWIFSRLDPSRFDDPSRTFTLAQYEAREPGLRHAHRIGSVLRQPVLHLRQGSGDVLRKLGNH